jgi:hypothetical protein
VIRTLIQIALLALVASIIISLAALTFALPWIR